jgi:hypothetical protein
MSSDAACFGSRVSLGPGRPPFASRPSRRKIGLARPRDERVFRTAFDQINELKALRAELPWLADVPRNVCAQLLVELDKAWQRCFKKARPVPAVEAQGHPGRARHPQDPVRRAWLVVSVDRFR